MIRCMLKHDANVQWVCDRVLSLVSLQKKRKAADGGGEGQEEMRVVRKYVSFVSPPMDVNNVIMY